MITENDLLEPRKAFLSTLQEEHHKNVCDYFSDLTKKAGTDTASNAATVKAYYLDLAKAKKVQENIRQFRTQRGWLITLAILSGLASVIFLILAFAQVQPDLLALWIVLGLLLPGFIVLSCIIIGSKINPKIKKNSQILADINKDADNQKSIAFSQVASLNALFDWNMHTNLVHKTIPLFEMDDNFNVERFQYLVDKFKFGANDNKQHSTIFVQSGAILGNPFVIETARIQTMGTCTYTGSITITYTVRVSNGNGGSTTQTRTQTLTASITKPKPYYHYEKWVHYGCEAAPDLCFSRSPVGADNMSEKEFQKFVRKKDEDLNKMSQEKIRSGFTPLANSEFEALFNAMDRDNEMQFRLLFTPLAQTNFMDLLRNKDPYGDDITFIKNKMMNSIRTEHSQAIDYLCDPRSFIDFDYEKIKNSFINFNDNYFQSFYFDMAPLMSIPLYQQYPTDEYIFKKKWAGNITSYESESMANSFNENYFAPQQAATPSILKSEFLRNEGVADRVNIHAYAFKATPQVEYVRKMGNDGCMHTIPVHWMLYEPVYQASQLEIQGHKSSRQQFNVVKDTPEFKQFQENDTKDGAIVYRRNLFSFCPKENDEIYNPEDLQALFKDDSGTDSGNNSDTDNKEN